MNKETFEEAAKRLYPINSEYFDKEFYMVKRLAFINGAKWMQERMYSEEDMRKCWNTAYIDAMAIDEETYKPLFFETFIEQFKKKQDE